MPGPWGWGPKPCGPSSTQRWQVAPSSVSPTALPSRIFLLLHHTSTHSPPDCSVRLVLRGPRNFVVRAEGKLSICQPRLPPQYDTKAAPSVRRLDSGSPLTVKTADTSVQAVVHGAFLKHRLQPRLSSSSHFDSLKQLSSQRHDTGNVSRALPR